MFGYVKTDRPNMYVKDTVLYGAMYCGLCKGIGKVCGQRARLVLNYDLTFLSVLLHNLKGLDAKIEKQRCVIHQIKKRPIAVPDELTHRIACLNVILARYKLNDDVVDNNKGRFKRAFLSKAYKRAKKLEPQIDSIVKKRYDELLALEKQGCDSVDIVADPFGMMMQEIVEMLMGEACDENVMSLAYHLGKWIYLIDALDDFDKDIKKNNFNVFVNMYKDVIKKSDLILTRQNELILIFASVLNKIAELSKLLKYKFNHDLTDNVLMRGLACQTKNIMENRICENTTKY